MNLIKCFFLYSLKLISSFSNNHKNVEVNKIIIKYIDTYKDLNNVEYVIFGLKVFINKFLLRIFVNKNLKQFIFNVL